MTDTEQRIAEIEARHTKEENRLASIKASEKYKLENPYTRQSHTDRGFLLDALRARAGHVVAGDWRTIESAPKDGTPVILYVPWRLSIGKITVAAFLDNQWHITQRIQHGERIQGGVTIPVPATHWMPLPERPIIRPASASDDD